MVSFTAPNHCIIYTKDATFFQSYASVIVRIDFVDGVRRVTLDKDKWDYSRTTARHRNAFLGMTTKETQAKIDSGEILLEKLN